MAATLLRYALLAVLLVLGAAFDPSLTLQYIRVTAEVQNLDLATLSAAEREALASAYASVIRALHGSSDGVVRDLTGTPGLVSLEPAESPHDLLVRCAVYGTDPAENAVGLFGEGFRRLIANRTLVVLGQTSPALAGPLAVHLVNVAMGAFVPVPYGATTRQHENLRVITFGERVAELLWGEPSAAARWAWCALFGVVAMLGTAGGLLVLAKSCPEWQPAMKYRQPRATGRSSPPQKPREEPSRSVSWAPALSAAPLSVQVPPSIQPPQVAHKAMPVWTTPPSSAVSPGPRRMPSAGSLVGLPYQPVVTR